MIKKLNGFNVAILLCDGFEEVEMTKPRKALEEIGANVDLITLKANRVKAWNHDHWSKEYKIDVSLEEANPKKYHALLLPGGVLNPDKLRTIKQAIKFAKHFFKNNKPIAAICHGPLTLIETGELEGRQMTSYPSIKTDLMNAGAHWVNRTVVIDDNLITSRKPDDIPAFNKAMIKLFTKRI